MPSADLYRLVYISRAIELLSDQQLYTLLEQARFNNQLLSVSGLLLYKDLSFIQVLEGSRSSLESVFASICKDPRHFRIKTLIDIEPIVERSFPEWSMGFQHLDGAKDSKRDGLSDFLEEQSPLLPNIEKKQSQTINRLFGYFRSHS